MNNEAKELWIAALKSGEYKQGLGTLRTTQNTYCCLGVLCDVYHKATGQGEWVLSPSSDVRYSFGDIFGFLPEEVKVWADVSDFGSYGQENSLVRQNDGEGKTFLQIAEIIQENF